MAQLLIISTSYDATVDVLLEYLSDVKQNIFRFNYDLINEYKINVTPNDFWICDPLGRVADLNSVTKVYWRKPHRKPCLSDQEKYVDNEVWYMFRSILYHLWRKNCVVLVEPFAEYSRLDKFTQLNVASKYFQIPNSLFSLNNDIKFPRSSIVKSMAGGRIGNKTLYASKIDPSQLDLTYPWFIQNYQEAVYDLTVVFVRGEQFHFRLDRSSFIINGRVDWKEERLSTQIDGWEHLLPSDAFKQQIFLLMNDMQLHYGRLDFLIHADQTQCFLEINPNGQFAWLDLKNTNGLLSKICEEINPLTPTHPIPFSPFVSNHNKNVPQ